MADELNPLGFSDHGRRSMREWLAKTAKPAHADLPLGVLFEEVVILADARGRYELDKTYTLSGVPEVVIIPQAWFDYGEDDESGWVIAVATVDGQDAGKPELMTTAKFEERLAHAGQVTGGNCGYRVLRRFATLEEEPSDA